REGLELVPLAQASWTGKGGVALPEGIRRLIPFGTQGDIIGRAVAALPSTSALVPQAVSAGAELVLNLFLLTVTVYYLFIDGRRIFRETVRILPLDPRYPEAFAREFREVAYALVYGNALTGLLQGVVAWVGLWFAGVPHPHIWALGMLFA